MENKYFTPSIEDIRIGYEVESNEWCMDESGNPEFNYNKWVNKKLSAPYVTTLLTYGIKKGNLRVPYLTKEQIEAEGWKRILASLYEKVIQITELDKIVYTLRIDKNIINITKCNVTNLRIESCPRGENYHTAPIYVGKCPSINEFRYISKLLGI